MKNNTKNSNIVNMKKLTIRNIGPITEVVMDLKRVNVVIGPQSVGKSCVLKIACFCAWAEKRIQLEQGKNGFENRSYWDTNLLEFHKLEGYIRAGSFIQYDTSYMMFSFDFDTNVFQLKWKSNKWKYKRSRISYIPAERSLVATVPNWMEVSFSKNNIRGFIADWGLTRRYYTKDYQLPIMELGVNYYFDENSGQDYIVLADGTKMPMTNGSSGLQSSIPMWAYLKYLFEEQYSKTLFSTVNSESENEEILQHLYMTRYKKGLSERVLDGNYFIEKLGTGKLMFASQQEYEECKQLYDAYTKTHHSDVYLEEPEQNLFPSTQVELVYSILSKAKMHDDSIFIATHSPYVLYALNNCMLGYLVGGKITEHNSTARHHSSSWINPKEVSVWEMKDGGLNMATIDEKYHTLQDKDGLIRKNYFDQIMKGVMTEFANYMAYYG